ncbi:hypothetical protein [Hyphomonas sp.]|uniref:hypothetical protein n=1 Tax=Hyphomonas sp. TaxID=87 RepID=UPI0039191393
MRRSLLTGLVAASALALSGCILISDNAPSAAPALAEVTTVEIVKEIRVETTPNLFILYTLKDGVTPEQFEDWVRTTDQPAMRSLARVQSFRTYRAERLLMGEGAPGIAYIEAFAIPDLDGFVAEDMGGETVQTVMGSFMGLAEAPQFIVVSEVK